MAVINVLKKKLAAFKECNIDGDKFLYKLEGKALGKIPEPRISPKKTQNSQKNDKMDKEIARLSNELEILKNHSSSL